MSLVLARSELAGLTERKKRGLDQAHSTSATSRPKRAYKGRVILRQLGVNCPGRRLRQREINGDRGVIRQGFVGCIVELHERPCEVRGKLVFAARLA
jgi:hypothetical protein